MSLSTMRHLAAYFVTRYGRAGIVVSAETYTKAEQSLDASTRAHKSPDGLGLVGFMGHKSFEAAAEDARKWEGRA